MSAILSAALPPVTCAVPTDEDAILSLLRMKHTEDGFGRFNEEKTRMVLRQGLERDRAIVGVVRGAKRIEGTTGLYVTSTFDSLDEFISDLWVFVHPDHRRTDNAKALLDFCKTASDLLGKPLVMARFANEATSQLVNLYSRRIGKPAGSVFRYDPAAAA